MRLKSLYLSSFVSGLLIISALSLFSYTYNTRISLQKSKQNLKSLFEQDHKRLDLYKNASKAYQQKKQIWDILNQQGFLKAFSLNDLEQKIKTLSLFYKFKHVEMNFEEGEEKFEIKQLVSHSIMLRLKSPYDSNIYKFLSYLRSSLPGILIFRKLNLERNLETPNPQVFAEISMEWVHCKEESE